MRKNILLYILILFARLSFAQDSTMMKAHPSYNDVTKTHKVIFGDNYREEWAANTKLPVLHISAIAGGLHATERGGGHQTHSLRLEDKNGKEWVLRTVEKYPEVLIPEEFRETFVKDWLNDNMSAQHPYGALIVPVLAKATGVEHTNPIIGVVAPDKGLGEFAADFENKLCLLEEREPLGDSDNTLKVFEKLTEDNDNSINAAAFLKATLLDILIGDWDRHTDQWRWVDEKDGNGKYYLPIPRDRDQVFYVNEGILPNLVSRSYFLPFLQGFKKRMRNVDTYVWESRLMANRSLFQLNYEEWMAVTKKFVADVPDEVLEKALRKLPASSYQIRHKELFEKMKSQRDHLVEESDKYFRFLNRVVDIQTSDKNEQIVVSDTENGHLQLKISKINKDDEVEQQLVSRDFDPKITKELRFFVGEGDDRILVNTTHSPIKMRVVGGKGKKTYQVENATRKIRVYDKNEETYVDPEHRLKKHISADSANTAIVATNRYDLTEPIFGAGYNRDDGLILGLGVRFTKQGFRKDPYASSQSILLSHSFSTKAFEINYKGEWIDVLKKADLNIEANIMGPNNTMNFYGRGNDTKQIKVGDYKTYYRTRYDMYEFSPSLKWDFGKKYKLSTGLNFQYYHADLKDNVGRIIADPSLLGTYDSLTVFKDKMHAGVFAELNRDTRNNQVLPSSGSYFTVKVKGYKGLNSLSESFVQILPEYRIYTKLTKDAKLVLSEKIGGGLTFGKTAFYQSLFLGGHDNLLGYHQYRFSGQHMVFNNLDLRWKLFNLQSYIIPGDLGITGFYDVGRVWEKHDNSNTWHHGVGGGVYFSPVQHIVVQGVLGYSKEGVYPYLKLGVRL